MLSLIWDTKHHLKAWFEGKGNKDISVWGFTLPRFWYSHVCKKFTFLKYVSQLHHRQTFLLLDRNASGVHNKLGWKCINQTLFEVSSCEDTMDSTLELQPTKSCCFWPCSAHEQPHYVSALYLVISIKAKQCTKWIKNIINQPAEFLFHFL